MEQPGAAAIRKMEALAEILRTAAIAGAEAYANGLGAGGVRGRPIVASHFTEGNSGRYGWAPLSQEYFFRKQGDVAERTNKNHNIQVHGASRVREDAHARFRDGLGIKSAPNAPMLVFTGLLRAAVTQQRHPVTSNGDEATVRFVNLPEYAIYLQEGTEKMPKRSPVDPNDDDREQVRALQRRRIDGALGIVRTPTGGGSGPAPGGSFTRPASDHDLTDMGTSHLNA